MIHHQLKKLPGLFFIIILRAYRLPLEDTAYQSIVGILAVPRPVETVDIIIRIRVKQAVAQYGIAAVLALPLALTHHAVSLVWNWQVQKFGHDNHLLNLPKRANGSIARPGRCSQQF